MAGYNTLCELLSLGTISLIIPREIPRKEQLIRTRILHTKHLVDYIPWSECSPEMMRRKVFNLLENPEPYREAIARFNMTGIEVMRERLRVFRYGEIFSDTRTRCAS
jgi:predicted glycosyltransferase